MIQHEPLVWKLGSESKCLLALVIMSLAILGDAKGTELSNKAEELRSHVAATPRLSSEQLERLRQKYGLSPSELERMPQTSLRPFLWQLSHPGTDLHAE